MLEELLSRSLCDKKLTAPSKAHSKSWDSTLWPLHDVLLLELLQQVLRLFLADPEDCIRTDFCGNPTIVTNS